MSLQDFLTIGMVGDCLTFIGGALLAYEALFKAVEFKHQKEVRKMISKIRSVTFVKNGIELVDDDAVTVAFLRQSAWVSLAGALTMTAGFILLLICRWGEIAEATRLLK